MKNKLLAVIVVFLIPIVVISFFIKEETNFILSENNNIKINLKLTKTNNIIQLDLNEYIIGVVAAEMPASFEIEALKAQSVAARTFVMNYIGRNNGFDVDDTNSYQVYINKEEMKDKWQNNYNEYYQKIAASVTETDLEILSYNKELVKAYYFSRSNGYTENSINVFKEEKPYLISVESSLEDVSQSKKEIVFDKDEFCNKLNLNSCQLINIKDIKKNSSHRVDSININNQKFSGIEIRKILKLRSTDFEIEVMDAKVKITTTGYGHGVGMSQYGANALAKKGYTYEQILKYYYIGTKLEKISSINK